MDQMSVVELEKSIAVPVSPPDCVYLGQIDLDDQVYLNSSSKCPNLYNFKLFVFTWHNLEVF